VPAFPRKRYNVIYADPPWSFRGRKLNAATAGKEVTSHYPVMDVEDIKELPVPDIADDNCLLFLWVPDAHVDHAVQVMECWGFRYVTVAFYWLKTMSSGVPAAMFGCWTVGGSVEMCLLARRGRVRRACRDVRRLVVDRRRDHSRKPDRVRDDIVRLVGDVPRIELFARTSSPGWDSWGDQVDSVPAPLGLSGVFKF